MAICTPRPVPVGSPRTSGSHRARLRARSASCAQFGFLAHRRLTGPSGRFALSVYRVVLPEGMALVPCIGAPNRVPPAMVNRHASSASHEAVTRVRAARRQEAREGPQLTLLADHETDGE